MRLHVAEPGTPRPVILDTDIGSDVDDILALVLLARAAEVQLIGVTTVYGDTSLRARMTRLVLDQMGLTDVPIGVGARETLTGGRSGGQGTRVRAFPGSIGCRSMRASPRRTCFTGPRPEHQGRLDLFAIGPLTNVAEAISADDSFATSLRHLYIMGGAFWMEQAEHNIKCDPEAADIVFRSGIPMTVCGLDVTKRVWLREPDMVSGPRGGRRHRLDAGGSGPALVGVHRRQRKSTRTIPWRSCRRFARNCSASSSAMYASSWTVRSRSHPAGPLRRGRSADCRRRRRRGRRTGDRTPPYWALVHEVRRRVYPEFFLFSP